MILVSLLRKSLKALRKPTVKIRNWKSGTPADPTHVTLPWPFNKPNCVSPLVWFQHGRVETGGTGWVGGGTVRLWSRDYRGVRWIQKGRDQQPSARTLGRSQSHDYRVCTVHRGLMTGIHWQESACACACTLCVCGYITQTVECVCVWVCAYLAMKIAGTAGLKKQPQGSM